MQMQGPVRARARPVAAAQRARLRRRRLHHVPLLDDAGPACAGAAGAVPTLLHSTAHDEPPLRMSIFEEVLRAARRVRVPHAGGRRARARAISRVRRPARSSVSAWMTKRPGDGDAFRRQFGLGADPYLLYVGRVDPAKGAAELIDYFVAYKQRNPTAPGAGKLRLVLLGEQLDRRSRPRRHRHDRLRRRADARRRARGRPRARAPVVLRELRDGADRGVRAAPARPRARPLRGAWPATRTAAAPRCRTRVSPSSRPRFDARGAPAAGRRARPARAALRRGALRLGRRCWTATNRRSAGCTSRNGRTVTV